MKKSILIVDDDKNTCESVARALSKDYVTYTAFNGREAFDTLLKNRDIEIVLTDINMPEMDGFELLKKIRFTDKNIITIMITGYSDTFTSDDALQRGAYAYLTKPINLNNLNIYIKNALENRKYY